VHIKAGNFHSLQLCLDSTGKNLYAFGRSCGGQLGHSAEVPEAGSFESMPVAVYLSYDEEGNPIPNLLIKEIACGENHSLVLTYDGDVFTWRRNEAGEMGVGLDTNDEYVPRPMKVDVTKGVNKLLRKKNSAAPLKVATTSAYNQQWRKPQCRHCRNIS